jgi:hypothetical protein
MGGSTGVLNDRKRWAYGFPRLQRFDLVNIGPSTGETGFHAARTVQDPGCRAPAPERTGGEQPSAPPPAGNDEDPDANGIRVFVYRVTATA